jgi:hypothetical protein
MGQNLTLPASFNTGGMPVAFREFLGQDESDSLSAGIGQSYGVLRYKGKVWSLRYRGSTRTVVRPDDGTPSAYIDVIILNQAKVKSKSLYKAYDAVSSEGERPLCSSYDGVVPDADIVDPPAKACAICPKNVWRTDPKTGRKGRDCTDYKRLAVLLMPAHTNAMLGAPLLEPVFLRVPPDSLQSLSQMGDRMSHQGFHYASFVTRITFDPNKAHPCMVFEPVQPLTMQELPLIKDLRNDATTIRIICGDAGAAGVGGVTEDLANNGPKTIDTGLTTAFAQVSSGVSSRPTPTQQGMFSGAAPVSPGGAQPATPHSTSVASGTLFDTQKTAREGLSGGVASALTVTPPSPTGLQSPTPSESDEALDRRIAAMITG